MPHILTSHLPEPILPTGPFFKTCFPKDLDWPELPAYVDVVNGRQYTRRDLKTRALRLALGIKKTIPRSKVEGRNGKRLALFFSPNVIDYPLIVFGCQACLTITSLASAAFGPREFTHQLVDGRPDILFVHPNLWSTAKTVIAAVGKDPQHAAWVENLKVYYTLPCALIQNPQDGIKSYEVLLEPEHELGSYHGDDLAPHEMDETSVLCYSSGTTGLPKGVETTHRNMVDTLARCYPRLMPKPGVDSILGIIPYYHIYGIVLLIGFPAYRPCTVYALPAFEPTLFFQTVEKYKVNVAFIANPIVALMATDPIIEKYDLSSLNICSTGGSAVSPQVLLDAMQRLRKGGGRNPGNISAAVMQGFGMTETTSPVISLHPRDAVSKVGSAGELYSNTEVMLIDEDEKPIEITYDESGLTPAAQLCMRSTSIMKGYWQRPDATRETFLPGGWLKTGDIVRIDRDGFFYIVERIKDMIKYKAFQVAPAELEIALVAHPKVAEASVIGVLDNDGSNELPRAYIVPVHPLKSEQESDALAQELKKYIADNLAHYKQLRGGVQFMQDIPKSAAGKPLRKELRAMYARNA